MAQVLLLQTFSVFGFRRFLTMVSEKNRGLNPTFQQLNSSMYYILWCTLLSSKKIFDHFYHTNTRGGIFRRIRRRKINKKIRQIENRVLCVQFKLRPTLGLNRSGCCSQTGSCHPRGPSILLPPISTAAVQWEFPPCHRSWPSHFRWCRMARHLGWSTYHSTLNRRQILSSLVCKRKQM